MLCDVCDRLGEGNWGGCSLLMDFNLLEKLMNVGGGWVSMEGSRTSCFWFVSIF